MGFRNSESEGIRKSVGACKITGNARGSRMGWYGHVIRSTITILL